MKFKPVGSKIIILQQVKENFKTEANIELIQSELSEGMVVEVSDEYEDIYPIGQVVLYSKDAGYSQMYNGKNCLIIDCRGVSAGGDIWAKLI